MITSKQMIVGFFNARTPACRERLAEIVLQSGGSFLAVSPVHFTALWGLLGAVEAENVLNAIAWIRAEGLNVSGGIDCHEPLSERETSITDPRRLRYCTERGTRLALLSGHAAPEILATDRALRKLGIAAGAVRKHGEDEHSAIYRMPDAA